MKENYVKHKNKLTIGKIYVHTISASSGLLKRNNVYIMYTWVNMFIYIY